MAACFNKRKICLQKCEKGVQINLFAMFQPYWFDIVKHCSHRNFDLPLII